MSHKEVSKEEKSTSNFDKLLSLSIGVGLIAIAGVGLIEVARGKLFSLLRH